MRAHSQEDRVPTELDIEGGYQGMLELTGRVNEASAEALVDTGHRVWRPLSCVEAISNPA